MFQPDGTVQLALGGVRPEARTARSMTVSLEPRLVDTLIAVLLAYQGGTVVCARPPVRHDYSPGRGYGHHRGVW